MLGESWNSNDSGVPHRLQNPRRAIFEEANQAGGDSQRTWSLRRLNQAARVFPKASWHIRQWQ
jgi:hypothetical protein